MDQGKIPDGGTPDGEARPGRRARPGGGYVVVWFPSPLRRGRVNGGRLDPAPDALGRDGERADVHAERRQGVLDRVGDGGGPGDGPALADALGPEGHEGRGEEPSGDALGRRAIAPGSPRTSSPAAAAPRTSSSAMTRRTARGAASRRAARGA